MMWLEFSKQLKSRSLLMLVKLLKRNQIFSVKNMARKVLYDNKAGTAVSQIIYTDTTWTQVNKLLSIWEKKSQE